MTTPDSTPLRNEVGQPVPQEIIELVNAIREYDYPRGQTSWVWCLTDAEAAALIIAERERFAAEKVAEAHESHAWEISPAMTQARIDQLHDELEQARKNCSDWIARENQLRRELQAADAKAERYRMVTLKQDVELAQARAEIVQWYDHCAQLRADPAREKERRDSLEKAAVVVHRENQALRMWVERSENELAAQKEGRLAALRTHADGLAKALDENFPKPPTDDGQAYSVTRTETDVWDTLAAYRSFRAAELGWITQSEPAKSP